MFFLRLPPALGEKLDRMKLKRIDAGHDRNASSIQTIIIGMIQRARE